MACTSWRLYLCQWCRVSSDHNLIILLIIEKTLWWVNSLSLSQQFDDEQSSVGVGVFSAAAETSIVNQFKKVKLNKTHGNENMAAWQQTCTAELWEELPSTKTDLTLLKLLLYYTISVPIYVMYPWKMCQMKLPLFTATKTLISKNKLSQPCWIDAELSMTSSSLLDLPVSFLHLCHQRRTTQSLFFALRPWRTQCLCLVAACLSEGEFTGTKS